jgi:dolichol-phosphate mannosyltransferase
MPYSIIIPIYNEKLTLLRLIEELKEYYHKGNEIILIDDGSSDGSYKVLKSKNFIRYIRLVENRGKGYAIKLGLLLSKNNKVILYDGDLELRTNDIQRLMILNKQTNINSVLGIRFKSLSFFNLNIDWGNFIFGVFYNLLNHSCHKDVLCCAKSFYKDDILIEKIKSKSFDIDVELLSFLTKNNRGVKIPQILLEYRRRSLSEGKKLKISDGWIILKRIILNA